MLEKDKSDYEANLSAFRNTVSKYYRTLATTQIPTSIQLKNVFATDSLSEAKHFSKFFASITEASEFIPTLIVSVLLFLAEFDTSIKRI